jgi:hypothetical protein
MRSEILCILSHLVPSHPKKSEPVRARACERRKPEDRHGLLCGLTSKGEKESMLNLLQRKSHNMSRAHSSEVWLACARSVFVPTSLFRNGGNYD